MIVSSIISWVHVFGAFKSRSLCVYIFLVFLLLLIVEIVFHPRHLRLLVKKNGFPCGFPCPPILHGQGLHAPPVIHIIHVFPPIIPPTRMYHVSFCARELSIYCTTQYYSVMRRTDSNSKGGNDNT